ncbi:hypothetical protein T484DRAFT_1743590 [Baffinella frigidus]|nr:hypothetical protein T484DRAFT_1743590 [Cryptophyta sp. CCMP2293]
MAAWGRSRWLALGLVAFVLLAAQAAASGTKYRRGDNVPLYANKVGPFANPSEQYEYYSLPFCAPKEEERKPHHLGEVLVGDRMMKTLFALPFLSTSPPLAPRSHHTSTPQPDAILACRDRPGGSNWTPSQDGARQPNAGADLHSVGALRVARR